MTKQFVDAIYYEDARHLPLSMSGKGLPHPRDFGLDPYMISTGCYRGFYCDYTIREDHLWLTHLVVNHDGDYPLIGGVKALFEEDRVLNDDEPEPEFLNGRWIHRFRHASVIERVLHYDGGIYSNLNVTARLTGGILLGIGDVEAPHVQLDLDYLIRSKSVLELLFERGELVKTIDHSAAVATKREEVLSVSRPKYGILAFDTQCKEWIQSTLTLNYKIFGQNWLDDVYQD